MNYKDLLTRVLEAEIVWAFSKRLRLLMIFFLVTNINTTIAQSDNYWSWNFNTKSVLLAGSVVGGGEGPSSVYYNPSLIDHENMQSLSMSAVIASLQFYNVDNMAGDGIDADKILFKVQQPLHLWVGSEQISLPAMKATHVILLINSALFRYI